MPKLTRKTQKLFAKNGGAIGQFGSAQAASTVLTTDPSVIQSLPAYEDGWNSAVISGQKRPPLEEFNGLKYTSDYQNAYLFQEGIAEYDSATTYYKNSLVKESGTTNIYKSLTDDNIGNPLNNINNWRLSTKLDSATNVIIVKQESDFGIASGGEILLSNKTVYQIVGDVLISNTLVIPTSGECVIKFNSYTTDRIISNVAAGQPTIKGLNFTRFQIQNARFTSATGLNKLLDLQNSDPLFTVTSEFYFNTAVVENFAEAGILKNILGCVISDVIWIQNGKIQLDNCFGITFNIGFYRNFISTGQPFVEMLTNISQMEMTGVAFQPTKGDSPMKIDPAISGSSGIAFGRTPYQGNVLGGILSFVNIGGGKVRVIVLGGTSFENGDFVTIVFSDAYDFAAIQISNVNPFFFLDPPTNSIPAGSFDITATFTTDTGKGQVALLNAGLTGLEIVPFFEQGIIEPITSVTNSGGLALFTTSGTAPTTGQSLFIKGTNNYDQGGFAVNVSGATFTLLNSLGVPVPYTVDNLGLTTATFNTGSLDQTNNVVNVNNSGGIIPDSQILGNNILSSTIAFNSITSLVRVSTGTWLADEAERFKATNDGRLIYTGRTSATVSISAKVVIQKQSGTTGTAFMNIMEKRVGASVFTEIVNHPSSQNQVTSSNSSQLTIAAIVENINPNDEFGIGIASDSPFTLDIFSIDFNIKK